jgi:hypothetical protein
MPASDLLTGQRLPVERKVDSEVHVLFYFRPNNLLNRLGDSGTFERRGLRDRTVAKVGRSETSIGVELALRGGLEVKRTSRRARWGLEDGIGPSAAPRCVTPCLCTAVARAPALTTEFVDLPELNDHDLHSTDAQSKVVRASMPRTCKTHGNCGAGGPVTPQHRQQHDYVDSPPTNYRQRNTTGVII